MGLTAESGVANSFLCAPFDEDRAWLATALLSEARITRIH